MRLAAPETTEAGRKPCGSTKLHTAPQPPASHAAHLVRVGGEGEGEGQGLGSGLGLGLGLGLGVRG